MRITIAEIAQKAGVSTSLVSQVLNNKPVRVSQETKDSILKIAKDLGYVANRMAAGLRSNSTNIIGCIVPCFDTQFYGDLTNALVVEATKKGYECMLCNSLDDPVRERNFLNLAYSGILDGIIAVPCDDKENISVYKDIKKENFPLVFLFRNIPQLQLPYAEGNRELDGYQATKAAIEKGYRNIGILMPEEYTPLSQALLRNKGYQRAMSEAGLVSHIYQEGQDEKILQDLQEGKIQILYVLSSRNAQYAFRMCAKAEKSIPYDVEVVVFDGFSCTIETQQDIQMMEWIKEPPKVFKTQQSDPVRMGKMAVRRLLEEL